jgi:hypothetical protein
MIHFLLVYDRKTCKLVSMREYPHEERQRAYDDRFALELQHCENWDMEIIVITSNSREALELTHSRYFKTIGELLRDGESLQYKR